MKKTILTSKSQKEVIDTLEKLKEYYHNTSIFKLDNSWSRLRLTKKNKFKVKSSPGYWKLNSDVPNEITIERNLCLTEYVLIFIHTLISILGIFLMIYNNRITFAGILVILLFFILGPYFFYRYLFVVAPLKIIERFIKKYFV